LAAWLAFSILVVQRVGHWAILTVVSMVGHLAVQMEIWMVVQTVARLGQMLAAHLAD
jgi:hypothetical protein